MGGAAFPPCWPTHPSMEPTACWVGSGPGEEMTPSRKAHVSEYSPEQPPSMSLSPPSVTAAPHLHRRTSSTSRLGRSGLGSYEVTGLFNWVLMCIRPSMHPPRVEFLQSTPAGLQSQVLLRCLLPFQTGEPDSGLRTFIPAGQLL